MQTNTCFDLKEGPGAGDCGFVCLIIGINSDFDASELFNTQGLGFYNKKLPVGNLEKLAQY